MSERKEGDRREREHAVADAVVPAAESTASVARTRLRASLSATTERLARAGIVSASVEARALLERAAAATGPLVLLDELPDDFDADLEALVARRCAREPLQLILGSAPFRRLRLDVRPGVFIPRPETEVAIDVLLEHERSTRVRRVVDLCTGSGALAAAVVDELPAADVTAVEIDPAAVDLAEENLRRAHRDGAPGTVRVLRADITYAAALAGLRGIDAVVSNPPYIPADCIPTDPEVLRHDPERALYGGGADGLDLPRAVIARAAEMLVAGGLLVMEHADVQGEATRALAEGSGAFADVRTVADLTGRDRFLVAVRRAAGDASDPITGSGRLTR